VKVFIAVALCRVLYFAGRLVGKGSSFPGMIALKFCPDVLKRLKLPKTVIAVTGSNGKTSTAELIARVLEGGGMKTGWNHEGSNQTEGVATLLLRAATLKGAVKCNALVLECDERYAKKIFEAVKPSVLVVTNLCRDQLSRNGHHEFIQDCLLAAIDAAGNSTILVLNADDPYVAELGIRNSELGSGVIWFGAGSAFCTSHSAFIAQPRYDDGMFCPMCKGRMTYSYHVAGHYGDFRCKACDFARPKPDVEAASIDYETGEIALILNSLPSTPTITTHIATPSLVGAYNVAASIAATMTAGLAAGQTARVLDKYELKGGRTIRLNVDGRDGVLLISKHENSFAYNQSMIWAVQQGKACTVIVLVDAISRKYFTSETSWLWDIDFDILADGIVKNVVLAGRYVNELASRFALSSVAQEKIGYVEDVGALREYVQSHTSGEIYAVTCFSDRAKLLRELKN